MARKNQSADVSGNKTTKLEGKTTKLYWKEVSTTRMFAISVLVVFLLFALGDLIITQMVSESIGWTLLWSSLPLLLVTIFLHWTFVGESTSKAIMRMGAFNRMVFGKVKYRLNNETYEVEGDPNPRPKVLGGLRFYIWPFESVYHYTWEWIKSMPDGRIVPKPEETVDFILTKNVYAYGLEVKGQGTVTEDKVPLEVKLTLTAEITNPYKALFDVKNWFDTFIGRVQPAIRDYIANKTYHDLIQEDNLDVIIYQKMVTDGIIGDLKESYGINLVKVEFRAIEVTEDYQKIVTAKLEGEREAEKRLASTTGAFGLMLLKETGLKESELTAQYQANPAAFEKKYERAIARSTAFIERQIDAGTPGALKSIHAKGFKGGGADLIALAASLFGGGGNPGAGGGSSGSAPPAGGAKSKGERSPRDVLTEEEWEDA